MGLFDFLGGKKRKEEKEAMEFLAMLAKHQADARQGAVDADELPNGVGPFGLVKTNPIPTRNVRGSDDYLSRLRTMRGTRLEAQRVGSTSAEEITSGMIDMYVVSADGQEVRLYLCPYHKRTSGKAPDGFILT
jgi:hypothetical protein